MCTLTSMLCWPPSKRYGKKTAGSVMILFFLLFFLEFLVLRFSHEITGVDIAITGTRLIFQWHYPTGKYGLGYSTEILLCPFNIHIVDYVQMPLNPMKSLFPTIVKKIMLGIYD
ncbi:hypothetical protein I3842_03G047900 [Carya illinoinensis]|uniref:Uncharacterized protein n=1 Tax=Carya illinoinensis TaxID=32201 RepID=A0A922JU09_CARIL|nr:hypothetical protein I3842_03G047900 [Carya illinoinensis]